MMTTATITRPSVKTFVPLALVSTVKFSSFTAVFPAWSIISSAELAWTLAKIA